MKAPRDIVIVQGHPDAQGAHLCHALADAYVQGARAAGHRVTEVQVAQLEFPLLRTKNSWEGEPLPDSLRMAQEALQNAQHLVVIFPLWLGGMPALLKGFFEQVIRPGLHMQARATPEQSTTDLASSMRGKSARIVVTMGMPALVFRWYFGAHGVKALSRGLLGFVGYSPVRTTLIGGVEGCGPEVRSRWLDRMRDRGRQGA